MAGHVEWTNSRRARLFTVLMSAGCTGLFVFSEPANDGRWSWDQAVLGPVVAIVSLCALVIVFSSRLIVCRGHVTAVGVWRVVTVPSSRIERVDPSPWPYGGLLLRLKGGGVVRSLVTSDVSGGVGIEARVKTVTDQLRAAIWTGVRIVDRADKVQGCSSSHARQRPRARVWVPVLVAGLSAVLLVRHFVVLSGNDWALHRHPGMLPTYAMVTLLAYWTGVGVVAALKGRGHRD